jgi:large subunit ribosomal protein L25
MANTIALKASVRSGIGRYSVKALRSKGEIPGVIYGKQGTQPIRLNTKELTRALHSASSENVLVDLQLSDVNDAKPQAKFVFLQDVQHDFLKDTIVHVDLHEIAPDEEIHVEVNILEQGEPLGVRVGGGLLETPLRRLRVACLPKDLPESIIVDVTHLEIGQAIHVGELTLPAGVTALNPKDQPVAAVHAPKVEEEPTKAAAATEPEVLKEKKTDAAAAPAKGAAPAGDKKGK